MSINDLMDAVRSGKFEVEFKKCKSISNKIDLFKKYGIMISVEQYKEIEAKVSAIKQGNESSYDDLEDKVECSNEMKNMSDSELGSIVAGKKLNDYEKQAVEDVLKRVLEVDPSAKPPRDDNDMKLFDDSMDVKPYLKGFF